MGLCDTMKNFINFRFHRNSKILAAPTLSALDWYWWWRYLVKKEKQGKSPKAHCDLWNVNFWLPITQIADLTLGLGLSNDTLNIWNLLNFMVNNDKIGRLLDGRTDREIDVGTQWFFFSAYCRNNLCRLQSLAASCQKRLPAVIGPVTTAVAWIKNTSRARRGWRWSLAM